MNTGYRCFVVRGDEVTHLSQRAFNDFYFHGKAALTQYANQVIVAAVVYFETESRKPKKIVRTDAMHLTVLPDGSLDELELQKRIRALLLAMTSNDGAIDTSQPELSPVAVSRMMEAILPRSV